MSAIEPHVATSTLSVLTVLNDALKKKALPIERVDNHIQDLMKNMLESMYIDEGIGLAANQVGVLKRVIVIDIKDVDDEGRYEGFFPLFMANPEYISLSEEEILFDEGCLSVPGEKIEVKRPKAIEVQYLDFNNKSQKIHSSGLLARVIQHEIDHLNGKTILDYVSKLRRDMIIKKLSKFQP